MTNQRHPLQGFLDRQNLLEASLAAEKEAKRRRLEQQRTALQQKWVAVHAALLEAIDETNALLANSERPERFTYQQKPTPRPDIIAGAIHLGLPQKPSKLTVKVSVTPSADVSLGCFRFRDFSITTPIGNATRPWWNEALAVCYRTLTPGN